MGKYISMSHTTIFGQHAVLAALQENALSAATLYILQSRHDAKQAEICEIATQQSLPIESVDRQRLDQLSQQGNHQGVLLQGEATTQTYTVQDLVDMVQQAGERALVLMLDGVQDPHNLGACLRSADAAGVTAVVIPKNKSCGLTATVRKVACGAAETVPLVTVANLADTLEKLKQANCWVVGLASEAEQTIYTMDFCGSVVVVVGAEGKGLRRLTQDRCDFLAKLPMLGAVSSLNVGVAVGIALYEAVRQRNLHHLH